MRSLHPLPHTIHLTAPQETRRPERRHHYEQVNLSPTSPTPFRPQGQRYLWGRRACHRQGHLRAGGEPAYLEGLRVVNSGKGREDHISAQNFKQRTLPRWGNGSKAFSSSTTQVLPHQEVLLQVVFRWVGRWVKTEAKYWKSIPTSHPHSWTQPPEAVNN